MRNCVMTSRGRAPTAMRMPISRVRSVTETSIMFMMPMPPTTSEIAATLTSKIVSDWLADCTVESTCDRFWMVKSSSSEFVILWRCSSNCCTSFWTLFTFAGLFAVKTMLFTYWLWFRRCIAVLRGMKTMSSAFAPKPVEPFDASVPTTVKGTLLMRTCWPTGSMPAEKRLSTTVCPRTATFLPLCSSESEMKLPSCIVQLPICW